jgi:hypothetical protein
MLGRLVLLLLQIAGGYAGANWLASQFRGVPQQFDLYLYAVIVAIVVFLIGLIAAQVVKDVGAPSSATLTASLVVALIAAALWSFGPGLVPDIPWGKVPAKWAILGGAILGYLAKR